VCDKLPSVVAAIVLVTLPSEVQPHCGDGLFIVGLYTGSSSLVP
jgi:hypothetical protein